MSPASSPVHRHAMARRVVGGVALGLLGLAGCAVSSRDDGALLYPEEDTAARAVMGVIAAGEVSRLDQWVLRPDEYGAVVVDHRRNLLYFGGREGKLLALDLDNGRPQWERDFGGGLGGRPILHGEDVLLVGTDDGVLHAVDLETHEDRWFYSTDGVIRNAPVVLDGVVYVANSQNRVFALDVRTGTWRWQYERPQPSGFTIHGRAGVVLRPSQDVMGGNVLYTGFDDGRVVAIDTTSGEALAIADLSSADPEGFSDVDATPLLDAARGRLVVATQGEGVQSLDLEDLSAAWSFPVSGAHHVARGPGETLVVVSSLEGVVCLDADGAERWRTKMNTGSLSAPVVVNDTIFLSHAEEGLYALDARSGQVLAVFEVGSGMSAAPVYDPEDRRLYAISNRGRLFVLRVADDV